MSDRMMSRGAAATLACVAPLTITRWANAGKLTPVRTPGGHRRFREADVRAAMEARKKGGRKTVTAVRGPA